MSVVTFVCGSARSSSYVSTSSFSTCPKRRKSQPARSGSYFGIEPACRTGHLSVRYCPGGRRSVAYPASATFFSALERNTRPRLLTMAIVTRRAAQRPRDYVRVAGPDAEEFLQRMVSNDVTSAAVVDALLLTAKGRVLAPLRIWRRADADFLLLTEPGLGEVVRSTLLRARFAAKCEIEAEEHTSTVVFGASDGIPTADYGE